MRKAWFAFWLSMPLVLSAAAPPFAQQEVKANVLDDLLRIESRIWTALQTKKLDGALPFLDKTYTGFESEVPGRFDNAEEHYRHQLAALKDVTVHTWEILNPRVQDYGNTAVLTYLGHDTGEDEGEPYEHVWKVTSVYVKRDGGWKIAHYHWSLDTEQ